MLRVPVWENDKRKNIAEELMGDGIAQKGRRDHFLGGNR
jgi:hypothetical protein